MDIFSVITLFGGLAFFLYGMHLLSSSLEKMVGGKLERILRSMTSNRFKALLLGMGITIAIQSSSAMTVMLVGLVNSGIMELGQTIGVIMGSNIGTTVTAWILSLSGITSDNVFVQLLKPERFSPIVALIGIILIMFTKSSKKKDIGSVCVGFAILMTGMTMMSGAVKPLADLPQFKEVLTILDNPIVAILVGAGITALIQSSAASLGILQSLAMTGSISFSMALPVIMGQNIGTCITALLSSIGTTKSAKRVTAVHDAARPFITPEEIETVCADAEKYGAATLAVPVKDTIKVAAADGTVCATPERSTLRAIQTPQVFRLSLYKEALCLAKNTGKQYTDDCQLIEAAGGKVYLTPGDYKNIKITTPEDLLVAEAFAAEK